jgi:2,4-dienoyl-CoA reductase (NADPH2)
VPTIATKVPRAAFAWVTQKLKGQVSIPLVTTNRINAPETAEDAGRRRLPTWCRWRARCWPTRNSSSRPLQGRADEINTCIGCNQACLDHMFKGKVTSCLVNPRACRETELNLIPTGDREAHRRGRRRSGGSGLRHQRRRTRP